LEGTREPSVAEAQAMALTELTVHAATDLDAEPRAMLLAADDYSAVSGKVPLSNLYERGRSLGIGVQVSAQSWQGLGANEDERYRIAGTADGGIFVLHCPTPATGPAGNDPTLLDGLPTVAGVLAGAPPRIKEALLTAFDIYALYSKDTGQVTIRAVLTEDTPGIVALLNDPRTDDD
jgi:hypothetical protein